MCGKAAKVRISERQQSVLKKSSRPGVRQTGLSLGLVLFCWHSTVCQTSTSARRLSWDANRLVAGEHAGDNRSMHLSRLSAGNRRPRSSEPSKMCSAMRREADVRGSSLANRLLRFWESRVNRPNSPIDQWPTGRRGNWPTKSLSEKLCHRFQSAA